MKPTPFRLALAFLLCATGVVAQVPAAGNPPANDSSYAPPATNAAPAAPPIADPFAPAYAPPATNAPAPVELLAPAESRKEKPAPPKLPGLPLRGKVIAVDSKAMTFTVAAKGGNDHVVHLSSTSRYDKGGKPASVSDIAVDDSVSGRIRKNKRGEEVLIMGSFTAHKAASGAAKKPGKKTGDADGK